MSIWTRIRNIARRLLFWRKRGGTHIQKVEIVVSSKQDPSRIARLTREALESMAVAASAPKVR